MPIYFNVTDEKERIILPGSVTIKRFNKWHLAESAQTSIGRTMDHAARHEVAKDMILTRKMDSASVQFAEYATLGKEFNSVLHMVSEKDSATYMSVNMDGVLISAYSVGRGHGGDGAGMETLVFNYRKIAMAYTMPTASATSTVETAIQSFLDDIF
jgi:type VI protein secretion system component Hcp